jgi:hypothetical protein
MRDISFIYFRCQKGHITSPKYIEAASVDIFAPSLDALLFH